ncbi:kinase-like protein [Pleomassaria siparia CBS 279.74]|uniref:non-specific serine/threonine protein kinase n=1 Tax=Pleomassaria siparia CBS 279.74 TaxID=1314801 RepID=A0A6G1KBS4_9PLEO|nr:kinase-like protein [Pleomassaria siparia CBS 279.74]
MTTIYKDAKGLFGLALREHVTARNLGWSTAQKNWTITAIWWEEDQLRPIYEHAIPIRPQIVPPLPAGIDYSRPANKARADAARPAQRIRAANARIAAAAAAQPPAPPLALPAPSLTVTEPHTLDHITPESPVVRIQSPDPDLHPRLYPNYWPLEPWDSEPEDPDGGSLIEAKRTGVDANEEEQAYMKSQPLQLNEDESRWKGVEFIAAGAVGCAGLWVKTDETDTIIDRMVVKECRPTHASWYFRGHWRERRPREIKIHELVESIRPPGISRSHRNLIQCRGSRLMMRQARYRLYLEHCNGRNLWRAMEGRWFEGPKFRPNRKRRPFDTPALDADKVLPESFIWYIFGSLVDACLTLQLGGIPDDEGGDIAEDGPAEAGERTLQPGWKPITHLDITQSNVFTDWDGEESGNGNWPRIILSDFGNAFYNLRPDNAEDSENPLDYSFGATTRYPPEHLPGNLRRYTSKTDVWSIGAILWNLITNEYHHDGPRRGGPNNKVAKPICRPGSNSTNILTGENFPNKEHYSEALKILVRECLNFEPDERPDFPELRTRIDEHIAENDDIREQIEDPPPLEWFDRDNWGAFTTGELFPNESRKSRE